MARRDSERISGTDKAKVRVFFAEVEGNNESIQEAMKTMVSAMSRHVRVIPEQKVNGNAAVLLSHADVEAIEEPIDQVEEAEGSGEEPAPPNARKRRSAGKKIDRNVGLDLVPDLNFRPSGKHTLKEFVDEKSPKTALEIALAVIYFMQHPMALPKISPSHVMTAFKEAGKPIPMDVRQTIRNARKSKAWLKYSDIEGIRTTTQGENFVEHEMGKDE